MYFLTVNCGSSSIKVDLVNPLTNEVYFSDMVEKTNSKSASKNKDVYKKALNLLINKMLSKKIIDSLSQINIVCHRVVHGGDKYVKPTLINRRVKTDIFKLSDLAPLHNPFNLEGIVAAQDLIDCPHYAIFDTAFHSDKPELNKLYALPYSLYKKKKVQRYGFHGISHNYISNKLSELIKNKRVSLISCHIGSGCSLAAIKNGKSVDCTMGFTPLEGVAMSTRSGDFDPALIFYLHRTLKMGVDDIESLVFKKSGLLGLSDGYSGDMRDLLKPARGKASDSKRAIDYFVLKIAQAIMSQFVVLGKLDAIVFTAGIGERSAVIRSLICDYLKPFGIKLDADKNRRGAIEISSKSSSARVFVLPTNESLQMAKDTYKCVK